MTFSVTVYTGDIFLISLDEKYKKRIYRAGFSTFNKIRKVLPETGYKVVSSILWLGCTRLRRFITTPRCSLGSPLANKEKKAMTTFYPNESAIMFRSLHYDRQIENIKQCSLHCEWSYW